MIDLKSEFKRMIEEADKQNDSNININKLHILTAEDPIIIAGINTDSLKRQLYIAIGEMPWSLEELKSLPKWRGLSLTIKPFENLFLIKSNFYLIIQQEDDQNSEIFESILQNLVDHLLSKELDESLFTAVYKVLDRWRAFFQRGGFRKLSDEQQRGLFGELWFIDEWLEKFPGKPPLVIENWEGPTMGRLDFKNSGCGLEIKTAIDKLSKTIKISNEDQLKLTQGINTIYIYVCFLEQSRTHGMTLQELAHQVRTKLSERSDRISLIYNDLLTDLGFREDEYTDVLFFVEKTEVYEAAEGFPRILKEDLPKGISHVSYSIDLTHCGDYERDQEEVYQYFRVDG